MARFRRSLQTALLAAALAVASGAALAGSARADETAATSPDAAAGPAPADEGPAPETIVVVGRGESLLNTALSASQGAVGADDFRDMPLLRRGELLETVPGLVVTQHSGDGKANQYFLRGFNLDHGTDFAFSVDGVPVNLPTHAHGQGYSDLNFTIPELISSITYKKGPFYAEVGDFSGSGAADLKIVNRLPQGIANAQVGMFGFVRALVADSPDVGSGNLLYAAEYNHYDGPWVLPEASNRLNGVLRYHWGDSEDHFTLSASGYLAPDWHSTDQVAQRAIDANVISRDGALDTSDGGNTGRASLSFNWQRAGVDQSTSLLLYGFYYRLNLFSNFTYYLDDPVNGDQFEQEDERFVSGGELKHTWHRTWWGADVDNTVGLQLRNDYIPTVGLYHTVDRRLLEVRSKDRVEELSAGLFARSEIRWNDWLRTMAGLRADVYAVDVKSNDPASSGSASSGIVTPKLGVILGPWAKTAFYADVGTGFHSNDARGVTIGAAPDPGMPPAKVPLLVRTFGAEVGTRTAAVPKLVSTLSFWYLRSDSELTFAGDSGDTEANPASEKYGVELANFYKPTPWLTLSADVSLTHARYLGNSDGLVYIANSIPAVISAGATVGAPTGLYGSARLRYFSAQPLVEDDSVEEPSSTIVDAKIGYRYKSYEASIELLNLVDSRSDDIAYWYASRLKGEPAGGVDDVHLHPAEPFEIRAGLTMHY